jgi:hypothetical protein
MPSDPGRRAFLYTPQEKQRIIRRVVEKWLKSEAGQRWQKEWKREEQIDSVVRGVVWINKGLIVLTVVAAVLTLVEKFVQ